MGEPSLPPPPPQPAAWQVLLAAGAFTLANTAFPRLGRMLFWTAGLGPRRFAAYLAARVALQGLIELARPWAARKAAEHEERRGAARAALVAELGREPTDEELFERLMAEAGER